MKSFADTAPNSPFSWDDESSTQFGKLSFRAASIIVFALARCRTKSLRVTASIPLPLRVLAQGLALGPWLQAISNHLQQSKVEVCPVNARWLGRTCPKCRGVLAVIVRPPDDDPRLQAVNGRCLRCGYRMAWAVIRAKKKRTRAPWLVQWPRVASTNQ
jgi:hypothetical protein